MVGAIVLDAMLRWCSGQCHTIHFLYDVQLEYCILFNIVSYADAPMLVANDILRGHLCVPEQLEAIGFIDQL